MILPAQGILLIANPFLKDPNFIRTVIFLCEHQDEGTFGFVLNRKYPKTLNEFIPELLEISIPVYYGGPVQMETIHFLHQYPELGGTEVMNGVYWGGNFETLLPMIRASEINFNRIRFFLGYSGWIRGQLEDELQEKSWLTAEAIRELIFSRKPEDIWKDSLTHLGGEYKMMINFPIDPQLN